MAGKQKHPGGRPSKFTQDLAKEICRRIIEGNSLSSVCRADDMPHRDSVHTWLAGNKEFSDNYARACEIRRLNRYDDMENIARNEQDVQRARLILDTIKWQLSKEEPKKYGDRLDLNSESTVTHKYEDMSDDQLAAAIKSRKDRIS